MIKGGSRRPRMTVQEWLVVGFASLTLAFTAWGFAGVIGWTVHVMLVGGCLTFLASIIKIPVLSRHRNSSREVEGGDRLVPSRVANLFRFPAFWFSVLFLIYLGIQAFNPSLVVVHGETGWWLEDMKSPLASWLPSGVRSDYEPMNAFRVLEWFVASFFLMWGIWIGLTHRKSALIILWALVLSGSAMAFVAIIQYVTEADRVLWILRSSNEQFWGSFFYRNQGAAYLNLILIGAGVLYFYYAKRAIDHAQYGGPHFLFFLLVALVASSVGLALSRGGILFGGVLIVVFMLLVFLQRIVAAFSTRSSWVVTGITCLVLVGGVYGMATQVDVQAIQKRFGDVGETIENAEYDARAFSSKATWDMAQDNLWMGWGAGSFRYVFPIYQRNYPEIFHSHFLKYKREWRGRRVYHYAHNDILQFLAEYGVIGSGLLLITFISLLVPVLCQLFSHSVFQSAFLLLGLGTIAVHAFLDFILNSPAYWVALVGLLAAFSKLSALEGNMAENRRLAACGTPHRSPSKSQA